MRERIESRRIWRSHLFGPRFDQKWRQPLGISECFRMVRHHNSTAVISKRHEWMDTFQMNPKAICADMAFHHPHDMQAFYRMRNVKRFHTGPQTPWPNRAEMGVRSFKKLLSALVDTASKILDQTTLSQITPAQLMRKPATGRNTQVTRSGKTPLELSMRRRPRDLMDPTTMNPEQLTSRPTRQDLLNEEIRMLAMKTLSKSNNEKTFAEILQRE